MKDILNFYPGQHLHNRHCYARPLLTNPTTIHTNHQVLLNWNMSLTFVSFLSEMVASQEQMNLAQLPLEQRDYCAQYLLKLMKCKRDNWPNFLACKHERHDWDYCEHQE